MQKLVWQNAKGEETDLTSGNFGITEWEGFSNTGLNIQTQTVPFQDGGVFLDALIEQRELSVTLAMQDNNDLELRYQNRRNLISALNPKLGEGYLIYTNDFISKRIKCIPQIPLFENHNSNDSGTPKASLSWTACSPYWEDLEETEVVIGAEPTLIQNEGDVPVGFELTVIPSGNDSVRFNTTQNENHIEVGNNPSSAFKISTLNGNKVVEHLAFPITENSYTGIEAGESLLPKSISYCKEIGKWLGCSGERVYSSQNCIDWTSVYILSTQVTDVSSVWTGSKYFLFGDNYCITTTDGVNFTTTDISDVMSSTKDCTFNKMTGEVFACGEGIARTEDGINFTQEESASVASNLQAICWNSVSGDIIAVRDKTKIFKRESGAWVLQNPLPSGNNEIFSFCFEGVNGEYIMGGFYSGVYRVSPTITEISYTPTVGTTAGLYSSIFKLYYLSGYMPYSDITFLWQSENGDDWERGYYGQQLFGYSLINKFIEYEGDLYMLASLNKVFIMSGTKNIIDKLTSTSNMNMKIETGNNYFYKTSIGGSDISMTLKYRQKYIGV